jgi:hypothetical protein
MVPILFFFFLHLQANVSGNDSVLLCNITSKQRVPELLFKLGNRHSDSSSLEAAIIARQSVI